MTARQAADALAARNVADRRRVLVAAIADERRGLAIRAGQLGRTDAIERNIARLVAQLDALDADTARRAA